MSETELSEKDRVISVITNEIISYHEHFSTPVGDDFRANKYRERVRGLMVALNLLYPEEFPTHCDPRGVFEAIINKKPYSILHEEEAKEMAKTETKAQPSQEGQVAEND